MGPRIRLLIIEGPVTDVDGLVSMLSDCGFHIFHEVVTTEAALHEALSRPGWNAILCDQATLAVSAPVAFAITKKQCPDLPFIIVSDGIERDLAGSWTQQGADDYVPKSQLIRLAPVLRRCLQAAEESARRQQAEHLLEDCILRYQCLFETVQEGILLVDAYTGVITDANPFIVDWLGYAKEDLVGKKLWELGLLPNADACKRNFQELQRQGYARYQGLPLRARDGQQISVDFISHVYRPYGSVVVQISPSDVALHRRAEPPQPALEELRHQVAVRTAQQEQLNREFSTFSALFAHELGTLARHIDGFAHVLRKECAAGQTTHVADLTEKLVANSQRMNDLIKSMLKLASISAATVNRRSVDPGTVVRFVADELQRSDPTREVVWHIAEGITANADAALLRIVLDTVLHNAWKYTVCETPADIEFGAARQVDDVMAYFVRDNGISVDTARSDPLFRAFRRVQSEGESPGAGIGLATVQRIVHRHGGRVWADSLGKGATVWFTLDAGAGLMDDLHAQQYS